MIHREGGATIGLVAFVLMLLNIFIQLIFPAAFIPVLILSIGFFLFILSFFRNPTRIVPQIDDNLVYAPCDGKVVVIEEADEPEYLNKRVRQVSIFMSPLNVHVNRNPVNGTVSYAKYHPGSFLAAWEPKASTENERTSIAYQTKNNTVILMRQIAGALARRIIFYVKAGDAVKQGDEMGFIKFGSRVDLYLPLDAEIKVGMNEVVNGNLTVIARLK